MSLSGLQSAASAATERHASELDARDVMAVSDAEGAFLALVSRFTEWAPSQREELAALVTRHAARAADSFAIVAREHAAAELGPLADEARRVANRAPVVLSSEPALRALADGLALRLDAVVSASGVAALTKEAGQVGRIVQTESFAAYNAGRQAAVDQLIRGGHGESFRIPTSLTGTRDAGDWVVGIVKRWNATLDRRACSRCRPLARDIVVLGMAFSGEPNPPLHARCRCFVSFWPIAVPKQK